jgi:hypothetical protein
MGGWWMPLPPPTWDGVPAVPTPSPSVWRLPSCENWHRASLHHLRPACQRGVRGWLRLAACPLQRLWLQRHQRLLPPQRWPKSSPSKRPRDPRLHRWRGPLVMPLRCQPSVLLGHIQPQALRGPPQPRRLPLKPGLTWQRLPLPRQRSPGARERPSPRPHRPPRALRGLSGRPLRA